MGEGAGAFLLFPFSPAPTLIILRAKAPNRLLDQQLPHRGHEKWSESMYRQWSDMLTTARPYGVRVGGLPHAGRRNGGAVPPFAPGRGS